MKAAVMTEEKKPTREELCRPVSLGEAERILRRWYPRYAYDRYELRRMALARAIPCDVMPRCGLRNSHAFKVRVWDLLRAFAGMATAALDSDGTVVSMHNVTPAMPQPGSLDN